MAPWSFALYVIVFAFLLTFPVSRLILNFSVRRLQAKLRRELSNDELSGQKRRALILAGIICLVFSFFFSVNLVGMPSYG